MAVDLSIRTGGQAGQGVQSVSFTLGRVFSRQGYHVFVNQDVESRIRGGHNFTQVRISDGSVDVQARRPDVLVALDERTIEEDLPALGDAGVLIYDGKNTGFRSDNPRHLDLPLQDLAMERGKAKIMINTVATGAALSVSGFALDPVLEYLEEQFRAKGKEIVEKNRACAEAGYAYAREHFKGTPLASFQEGTGAAPKLFLSGSEAIAFGAICAGLKFYAGYPMSPATSIMEFVAAHAEACGIIMEPVEDEIAAVNMAVGASFAGARAMTATSGGGFCLMTEAVGLAGMTETPLVIVVAQRPGPSTGLPTRTEQGDLRFVMHASHGEYPRAIFAPGNAEQAFSIMGKAFNTAERFQTPVVVLGDQHLNDSYFTVDGLDPERIPIDRGAIIGDDEIDSIDDYARYAIHPSGISPRILPGLSKAVVYADSDEHTEQGHITESADVRERMMRKRMTKLEGMRGEMDLPEAYGDEDAGVVLTGWGSTYGALKEAVDVLRADGIGARMVHFHDLFPLPEADGLRRLFGGAEVFAVENNFTGQFTEFLCAETGIEVSHKILSYDGRPFDGSAIAGQVRERR